MMMTSDKHYRGVQIKPRDETPGISNEKAEALISEAIKRAIKRTEPLVLTRFDLVEKNSNANAT
jgi:hypothetical protein